MCCYGNPTQWCVEIDNSGRALSGTVFGSSPLQSSTIMWRNIAKSCSRTASKVSGCSDTLLYFKFRSQPLCYVNFLSSLASFGTILRENCNLRRQNEYPLLWASSQMKFNNVLCYKAYASVAEALEVSNTDMEEDNNAHLSHDAEFQEMLKDLKREERSFKALKRRQVKIETEAWEKAVKEYQELLNEMCERKLAPNLPYMKSLFLGWFEPLRKKIAEEQEAIRNGKNKSTYAKYFDRLPADMMAVIAMHKLMGLLMTGGEHGVVRVVLAACTIGDAIEQEARIHYFLEKTKKKKTGNDAVEEPEKLKADRDEEQKLHRRVTTLMKKQKPRAMIQIVKTHVASQPWSVEGRAKVGSRLIELIIQTAYIQSPADPDSDSPPEVRPAFMHTSRTVCREKRQTRRYGVVQCDPLVHKGLEKAARHMVIPYMPMLVPPVNWTGYDKGGYLFLPSQVMRTHGAKQQREAVKRVPREQLYPVYEALDTLGTTGWRVNKRVFSIVERIWGSGGNLAGMVDRNDIAFPEQPETEDETLLKKWKWKVRVVKKENSEKHSLRCDTELKLAVARKLKDEDGFFYPHNLDFRGRAYPMHPHLNHLGSDICRGILEFSEGRPLGKSGLHWLKIHLANLYANGIDKLSHEGRLAFTDNHLDDICDSADRPLEGKRWWLSAEDPFQCLAACIDLAEALRCPSPEMSISHIPVHQDGSCNGLQHYAALGRDTLGAAAVNLVAGEKPADVYTGIANRVLDIMKEDAKKDPAIFPDALRARTLINQVDRKLVKQTVMTSVYGVTYVGARDQITKRLKERDAIADDVELFGAACYAAKVILKAIGQIFEAAHSIMSWLGDCAKKIAEENKPVEWTTPLGLPVVQPYRSFSRHLIKTSLQVLTLQRESEKVLARRQRTAFPPNFVHSLDGSHMMMTAVACKKTGLNFAGVHDSYWTHACDVDELNRILREKFVELYELPILENLLESFQVSFPTLSFPRLPPRGDFDLREVMQSPYFFN